MMPSSTSRPSSGFPESAATRRAGRSLLTSLFFVAVLGCSVAHASINIEQLDQFYTCCVASDPDVSCDADFCALDTETSEKLKTLPAPVEMDDTAAWELHAKGEATGMFDFMNGEEDLAAEAPSTSTPSVRFTEHDPASALFADQSRHLRSVPRFVSVDVTSEAEMMDAMLQKMMASSKLSTQMVSSAGLSSPYVSTLWAGAKIPYALTPAVLTTKPCPSGGGTCVDVASPRYGLYTRAMKKIAKHSCIRFDYKSAAGNGIVTFDEGVKTGCYSNGLGTAASTVVIDTTTTDLDTVIHELMHVAGVGHTHIRKDRDRFVKVDKDKCRLFFMAYCDAVEETPQWVKVAKFKKAAFIYNHSGGKAGGAHKSPPDATRDPSLRTALIAYRDDKSPSNWEDVLDEVTPAERARLTDETAIKALAHNLCFQGWWAQYRRTHVDRTGGTHTEIDLYQDDSGPYDYGSEMHYPFNSNQHKKMQCMVPLQVPYKNAKKPNPGANKITPGDSKTLNGMYGCTSFTARSGKVLTSKRDMHAHPDWTVGQLKTELTNTHFGKVKPTKGKLYRCVTSGCKKKTGHRVELTDNDVVLKDLDLTFGVYYV